MCAPSHIREENSLDSLTLVVKMLDIFVFLVKCLGIVALAATAGLLIKLLPKKLQIVVKTVATAVLFVVLLGENTLNMFVMSAIRQGIWVLGALGIFVIIHTSKLICALRRRSARFATLMARGYERGETGLVRQNSGVSYFSSFLRQTPLMLN